MKKYIVVVPEVWIVPYEVLAETPEAAKLRALEGIARRLDAEKAFYCVEGPGDWVEGDMRQA